MWEFEQKLTANDGAPGDFFGVAAALRGARIAVGAIGADCALGEACGAAYLFQHNGAAWVQTRKLVSSQPDGMEVFGGRISATDDILLIKGRAAAYVYRLTGAGWTEQQRLVLPDPMEPFVSAAAAGQHILALGSASTDCGAGINCGTTYIFESVGDTWVAVDTLTPVDVAAEDRFGEAVAIDGDVVVVGASGVSLPTCTDCGAAYVYTCPREVPAVSPSGLAAAAALIALVGAAQLFRHTRFGPVSWPRTGGIRQTHHRD